MKKILLYSIGLIAVFALGYVAAHLQDSVAHAQAKHPAQKAAYLIASTKVLKPGQSGPYSEAARPLAQRAGLQMVASGESGSSIQLLEGKWPYEGRVAIEKFDSMKALLDFWNSAAYQKAKKLREGVIHANFIVAIEAVE